MTTSIVMPSHGCHFARRRPTNRALTLGAILSAILSSSVCLAGPKSTSATSASAPTANSLLSEARKLVNESRLLGAIDKFKESLSEEETVDALLGLGDCYDRLDRSASAKDAFRRAEELARGAGDTERADEALARSEALAPRLRTLRIVGATGYPTIKLDKKVVEPSVLGSKIPVDYGLHTVQASSPGYVSFQGSVEVTPDQRSYELTVPELKNIPDLTPKQKPPPVPAPATSAPRKRVSRLVDALLAGSSVTCAAVTAVGFGYLTVGNSTQDHVVGGVMLGAGPVVGIVVLILGVNAINASEEPNNAYLPPPPIQVGPFFAKGGGGLQVQMTF